MARKESQAGWRKESTHTAQSLRSAAHAVASQKPVKLALPEIDAAVDLIAQVIPAGNVPGMILSGLARLPGRRPPPHQVHQHVRALFKGMEPVLDQAVYGAFFYHEGHEAHKGNHTLRGLSVLRGSKTKRWQGYKW